MLVPMLMRCSDSSGGGVVDVRRSLRPKCMGLRNNPSNAGLGLRMACAGFGNGRWRGVLDVWCGWNSMGGRSFASPWFL